MKSSQENRLARQPSARYVFVTVFLTFGLLLFLTACSGVSASTTTQVIAPTEKGSLSPAPTTIDFGTLPLNSKPVTSVLRLTNNGRSAEIIESATIAPTPVFSLQGWTGTVTIQPGQTAQIRTTFAPKSAGNYSGTLTLVTKRFAPVGSIRSSLLDGPSGPRPNMGQVEISVTGAESAGTSIPIVVSVSPISSTLQSGQSEQFTSSVTGTPNTAVTWTAVLGSITSSGIYTAPTVNNESQDTVSAISVADPTKFASASVTVSVNNGSVNTFYVDPANGSDSNNGTSQATAWRTLCKANASATLGTDGTQITLLPGTFTLANQGSCYHSSGGLLLTLNGTSTQRVIWQGLNDPRSNPTSTILNGGNGPGVYVNSNYSDFIQLEITGAVIEFGSNDNNPANGNNDSLQKSYLHDAFTSCETLGVGLGGFFLTSRSSNNGLVDSNVVNNIGVPGGCSGYIGTGPHGIYVAGYHYQVTNNLVSNAEGYGIHSYHDACESNITNNTVVHNYAGGILVSAGPDTGLGCQSNGGDWYTVDNNLSVYNSWGCGVIDAAGNAAIQGGIIVYNTGASAVHNVGYNNYLISNWTGTGNSGCTNSPGTNNAFVYKDDQGGSDAPFVGEQATTLSATTVPSNGFVNPCSSSTLGSTACNVVPIARGGAWDWNIVSGGPFDGAGGSGCSGSPGYTSPCIPTLDTAGFTRESPSAIGAY